MLPFSMVSADISEEKTKAERLYYRYRALIKYIGFRILEDEDLAEDVVSETMVAVMENIHRFRAVDSEDTRAFVSIIARNKSYKLYAANIKRSCVSFEEIDEPTAREDVLQSVYLNGLLERIAAMPERYRDVLQLRVQYDLPLGEIGRLLGIPTPTVRKRLQRAREYMRGEKNDD